MSGCREYFHINPDFCKKFVDGCCIHAENFAKLTDLSLKWLHSSFYLLVKVLYLRLDVGYACANDPYHELVIFCEASLNREGYFLFDGLQPLVGAHCRKLLRVGLSGDYCVYEAYASFATYVGEYA